MKKLIKYIMPCFLLIAGGFDAQVIDLSTGVDLITGLPEVLPATCDRWQISQRQASSTGNPGALAYSPVSCTNDFMRSPFNALVPLPATGSDPNVRWLSSDINAANESVWPSVQQGFYYFRRQFDLPAGCYVSATLDLKHVGVDNKITNIFVNGSALPGLPSLSLFYTANVSINVPTGYLTAGGGLNSIYVEVENTSDWMGFEVNGFLKVQTCGTVDFTLRDKDGAEKADFCLGEDVFLDGITTGASSYLIDLWEVTGNGPVWLSQQSPSGYLNGTAGLVNIRDLFENSPNWPVQFAVGKTYRVKLAINASCWLEKTMDFTFYCCDQSADANFMMSANGNMLNVSAIGGATHQWDVYSMSPVSGQVNSVPFYSSDKPKISLPGGTCFYVKHTVTNDCGTDCKAGKVCDFVCGTQECDLPAPVNLHYDPTTKIFSWNPVPGAVSYVLEINPCDPSCCGGASTQDEGGPGCPGMMGGGGLGTSSGSLAYAPKAFNVPSNSYQLNPGVDLGMDGVPCFSWRVYAVCANGSRSPAGELRCSSAQ